MLSFRGKTVNLFCKSMFKSSRSPQKNYASNLDYTYKKAKRTQKPSFWLMILAVPALILLLELCARLYLSIVGGNSVNISPLTQAYQLKFLTENQRPIKGLTSSGKLIVNRSLTNTYQLKPSQKSEFWVINEQGFRDDDTLTLAKPKGEIRIFLLGSSLAFGGGLTNNSETIPHQLESLLKQRVAAQKQSPEKYRPDVFPFYKPSREKLFKLPAKLRSGNYRVINAAIPGYTSGNQLAQYALKLFRYQPDVLIVLDGYEDLMLSSDRQQADIPYLSQLLENPAQHWQQSLNQSLLAQWNGLGLVRLSQAQLAADNQSNHRELPLNISQKPLDAHLAKDEDELNQRISRYQNNYEQLIRLAAAANVPLIITLQPEITGLAVNKLSPEDRKIQQELGKKYLAQMPNHYQQLLDAHQQLGKRYPANVKAVSLYSLQAPKSATTFVDAIHLTKDGNQALTRALYEQIITWPKMQVIPENFYLKD